MELQRVFDEKFTNVGEIGSEIVHLRGLLIRNKSCKGENFAFGMSEKAVQFIIIAKM